MNPREFSTSFDTLGIIANLQDTEGLQLVEAVIRSTGDQELTTLLGIARGIGMRYLVVAGRFNGSGVFSAMCADQPTALLAWSAANERMREGGAAATAWMVKPDSLASALGASAGNEVTQRSKP